MEKLAKINLLQEYAVYLQRFDGQKIFLTEDVCGVRTMLLCLYPSLYDTNEPTINFR